MCTELIPASLAVSLAQLRDAESLANHWLCERRTVYPSVCITNDYKQKAHTGTADRGGPAALVHAFANPAQTHLYSIPHAPARRRTPPCNRSHRNLVSAIVCCLLTKPGRCAARASDQRPTDVPTESGVSTLFCHHIIHTLPHPGPGSSPPIPARVRAHHDDPAFLTHQTKT